MREKSENLSGARREVKANRHSSDKFTDVRLDEEKYR